MITSNMGTATASRIAALGKDVGEDKGKLVHKILDGVRRNLWTLTCQADIVELTGVLEDFGGEKDVEGNIAKAIFGLHCLGTVFGLDVSGRLGQVVADIVGNGQKEAAQDSGSSSGSDAGKEGQSAKEAGSEAAAKGATAADAPEPDTAGGEQRVKDHEKNLRAAKSRSELDQVWRVGVTADGKLTGTEKGALFKIYKERQKELPQK